MLSSDLNFSTTPRTVLFDAALEDLKTEYERRSALLRSRKADCETLQELCEFLSARGWQADGSVVALAYSERVQLQLAVTLDDAIRLGELLQLLAVQGIETSRNASLDISSEAGYELSLANNLKISARVRIRRLMPRAAP